MTLEHEPKIVARQELTWIIISLGLLTLFVLINGLLWMHVIPPGSAPDEGNHARIIAFIAQNHRLPILNKDISLTPLEVLPDAYVTQSPPFGRVQVISALLSELPASNDMIRLKRYGSLLFAFYFPSLFCFLEPATNLSRSTVTATSCYVDLSLYSTGDVCQPLMRTVMRLDYWLVRSGCGRVLLRCRRDGHYARCVVWGVAAGVMILGRYQGYILLPLFYADCSDFAARDPIGKIVWRNVVGAPRVLARCWLVVGVQCSDLS